MSKRTRKKPAGPKDPVRRPHNWEKAISVAYLRLLGATQEVSAKQAGVGERTLRTWEGCSWWADAIAEARQRWLRGGDAAAMRGLSKALASETEYAATARWWAERRMPELKPPKLQVDADVGGKAGAPLVTRIEFVNPEDTE